MRKLNLILQEFLKFILIFLLSFIWLRYSLRKLWPAVLLSLLISITTYGLMTFIKHKKMAKNGLKIKEKEDAENIFLSLSCNDSPIDFFVKLASKKHKNIAKHKNYIAIFHEKENVKTLLYIDLSFEGLNIARFMDIYNKLKKEKASKIVICCKEIADKNLPNFCENFNQKFLFLDQYTTYEKLYKYYDCYPQITHKYNKEKKMIFKDIIAHSFNKKRTKSYLFSAIILILSSLFVRTSIYYCVIASLLVVFALISQFNPYFNTKNIPEIL